MEKLKSILKNPFAVYCLEVTTRAAGVICSELVEPFARGL